MRNIVKYFKDRSSENYRAYLNGKKRTHINVVEFEGELWISADNEPIIPMSLLREARIADIMEKCRNGWMAWKLKEKES